MLWLTATATDVTGSITRQSYIFFWNLPNNVMEFYIFLHPKWGSEFFRYLRHKDKEHKGIIRNLVRRNVVYVVADQGERQRGQHIPITECLHVLRLFVFRRLSDLNPSAIKVHRSSSERVEVRLNISVVAPLWGWAKATPKPKAFTRRPAPIENPERKLRL